MLEGDEWKYGDAPEVGALRKYIQSRQLLLVLLPGAPYPLEATVKEMSPNEKFVMVESAYGRSWFDIDKIRIVDMLKRAPRTDVG